MDVIEAIRGRRTTKDYRPDPVPRAEIAKLLDAAVWAPNHHLSQPYRFTVLEGAARVPLAELRRAIKERELREKGVPPERIPAEAEESGAKLLRAPVLIVVSCRQVGDEIEKEEDFAATCAAIQNILLAGTHLGIATFWTSGPIAFAPETKELFGFAPTDKIAAIIHTGYPLEQQAGGQRPPPDTRWVEPREVPGLVARVNGLVYGMARNGHTAH